MAANEWQTIGTVVGNTSTYEYTFVLKSMRSRVGDLVAVKMTTPGDDLATGQQVLTWGRITAIERWNPFLPQEAATELAEESISLLDTVLSNSRDQLQAKVLILGCTSPDDKGSLELYPLTYPVQPAAEVQRPPAPVVRTLLTGGWRGHKQLHIGTLLARADVPVTVSADRVVSRHIAILAMTGAGKTVAARRILRELIALRYPILIFDPHGDYVGLWQSRKLLGCDVHLMYPHITVTKGTQAIVETLIAKMTEGLSEPQREYLGDLLANNQAKRTMPVVEYIRDIVRVIDKQFGDADGRKKPTMGAVKRSLRLVLERLDQMERTNERMRQRLPQLDFEELPDPEGRPEGIIKPGHVSILYLSGYDHLTQSTIVSVVMESLFRHRSELSNRIAPFLAVIEEAHNFIPSQREGTEETPSLPTLRKVITEGRKFGTGLLLITQRPSRVDETILAQCNSFLVLRLVNPKDQNYVRSVMENLSDSDARLLPGFGPGQGLVSGQAVRFPLLVRIKMDEDLQSSTVGDENFFEQAEKWKPDAKAGLRERAADIAERLDGPRAKRRKRR
jgi:DNA helicase HerA-like ATPase